MSSTTVAEFAKELKKSNDTLLDQLKAAGVSKSSADDALTEGDKQKLLSHLQAAHGTATGERKKITLVKKSTSEIKQADATGKARTIQVEVRKKRTFVKRDENEAEVAAPVDSAEPSAPAAPVIDQAELARREEEARRQAELIRRQEEELAEKRRLREAQEVEEQAKEEAKQAAKAKSSAGAESDAADEAAAHAAAEAHREAERLQTRRQSARRRRQCAGAADGLRPPRVSLKNLSKREDARPPASTQPPRRC